MEPDIIISDITKDYGNETGNFQISFEVKRGEAFGLVGENGAGKTTLIRQIMGFIRPDSGNIAIRGLDAYKEASKTKAYIGYVPGEINYPDLKTGKDFLLSRSELLGVKNNERSDELIQRLQLDIRAYPRRMSKGMKQKMAIVSALSSDAPIIIMDEPTTGLDPLMREEFLKIVHEEREKGKTILMSSNTIEELERTCDRVGMISKGRLVDIADVKAIENRSFRDYKIEFNSREDFDKFVENRKDVTRKQLQFNQCTIRLDKNRLHELFTQLSTLSVHFISEVKYDLSTYFTERRK